MKAVVIFVWGLALGSQLLNVTIEDIDKNSNNAKPLLSVEEEVESIIQSKVQIEYNIE